MKRLVLAVKELEVLVIKFLSLFVLLVFAILNAGTYMCQHA